MAFEPNGIASVLHWSLRCGSVFGVEVRLHWSLLLLTAVQALQAISAGLPWHWLPVLLLIPFFSVLLHEFGHVTAARLTGGSADRIVMWMFGGLAFCAVPPSPGRQFFVAAAGPAVTFALAAIGIIVVAQGLMPEVGAVWSRQGELMAVVAYATSLNAGLLLFNLIPCYPLDGGKMLRCTLWPVIGLRRAALATIWIRLRHPGRGAGLGGVDASDRTAVPGGARCGHGCAGARAVAAGVRSVPRRIAR